MSTRQATRSKRPSSRSSSRSTSRASATRTRRKESVEREPAPETGLPGWADLAGSKRGTSRKSASRKPQRAKRRLDITPTLRFAVITLLLCIGVTLYVGHVFATRTTLAELQQARRDNLRLHLTQDRLRGEFDRMTGPNQVMERATSLGMEEGISYGPTIRIND